MLPCTAGDGATFLLTILGIFVGVVEGRPRYESVGLTDADAGGLVGDAVIDGKPVRGTEPSAGATVKDARSRLLAFETGGPAGLAGRSAAAFDSVLIVS
jgi:hypothetical protein